MSQEIYMNDKADDALSHGMVTPKVTVILQMNAFLKWHMIFTKVERDEEKKNVQ